MKGIRLFLFVFVAMNAATAFGADEVPVALSPTWEAYQQAYKDAEQFPPAAATWTPAVLPLNRSPSGPPLPEVLWVRTRVSGEAIMPLSETWLLLGKTAGAVKVYLNGSVIYEYGREGADYFFQDGITKQVLIPACTVRKDGSNELIIRCFSPVGNFSVPGVRVGSHEQAWFEETVITFLNVEIYLIFSTLCLFLSAYYFLQFGFRREMTNLLFAMANLFFGIYFVHLGLKLHPFPVHSFGAFTRAMLPWAFASLTLFFVSFYNFLNKRWFKLVVAGIAGLFSLLILFSKNDAETGAWFTLSLIPGQLEILFIAFVAVRAVVRGNKTAIPVIIGTVIGVGLGSMDIMAQISGIDPPVWLQGEAIFAFNFSMFVTLSLDNIRLRRDLERFSREVAQKSGSLEKLVTSLVGASKSVERINSKLSEGVRSANESIVKLTESTEHITKTANAQFADAKAAGVQAGALLDSLENTFENLSEQGEKVEQTSQVIEEMLGDLRDISGSIAAVQGTAEGLGKLAEQGQSSVESSTISIGKIKASSETIYEIVNAVNEVAERTNLLAMNAAIEAAHAGNAGKGFAVVAGEIRRLAEAATARTQEIVGQVDGIMLRINDGVLVNEAVKQALTEITTSIKMTVHQVSQLSENMERYREESEVVKTALYQLKDVSTRIHSEANRQSEGSKLLREGMDKMMESSVAVQDGIKSIKTENTEIVALIEKINAVASESSQLIAQLRDLMEKGR